MKRPGYVSARGRLVSIDAISTDSASCPSKLPQKSLLTDVLDLSDSKLPFKGSGSDYSVLLNNPSEFTESETEVKSAADSFDCPSDLSLALGSPEETIASHLLPVLLRTFRELQVVTNYQENEEDERHISEDWKFAAMVVDRLSLIIFSSILVISTGAILFKAPHVA